MADILGSLLQGWQGGAQMRQQQDRRTLADLLGKARGASGAERDGFMQQSYSLDPNTAMQAEQSFGQLDDAKRQRLGQTASVFTRMTPEMRAQAWPTVRQQVASILPGEYPEQWDESLLPVAEGLAQQFGGGGAGYQEFDLLARDANLSPEDRALAARRQLYLDARPSSAAIQYKEVEGPDGRTRLVALDPREVGAQTIGGGGMYGSGVQGGGDPFGFLAQTGATVTSGQRTPEHNAKVGGVPNSYHLSGQARDILPPQTQEQAQFIRQQAAANGLEVIDEGDHWHLEPRGGGVNPFVGRRAEDEAYAEELAKGQAGLVLAPAQAQADAERARLVKSAEADVERGTKQPKARLALEQAKSRVQRVDALVDSILPRIGTTTSGWLGDKLSSIEGTPAADLRKDIGTLQAIAGFDELNAMRAASPTGGALGNVTERELAFLQSVVRNIENSQSEAQLRRNLEAFREELRGSWQRVQQAYDQDFGGQASKPASGTRLRFNPATGRIE